ncbi:uncharacterized protein LOC119280128 [Triticum dicoccoides]|uniref:uncharacterized protein LOC119280128 n=1 Tax=Triticum dicoccoides TaxID=85692 RepID=UPI00188E673E|nr:uncharacterized protein LOC119280128 [Triticum dicoccoides]
MVHCKQPRRGAREPAAVPTTGARARAGGGAAAVPASADPGYMRPTSSSGARAGREVASAASAPAAQPVGANAAALVGSTPRAARPTCASAQKSARALGGGGGCEGRRACRYAYCSFKGHAPAAPPLGAFLASRRGLIKTEQSMKHRGVSAFRNPSTNTVAGKGDDGFFIQVACPGAGARPKTASSGSCCSGLSAEEVESPYVNFGRRGRRDDDKWGDPAASVDGSCGSSDVISDGFADLPGTASSPSPGRKEQIGQEEGDASWVDQQEAEEEEDSAACDKSDISEELGARYKGNNMSKDCGGGGSSSVESSMDDISSAFGGMNFEDAGADAAATSQGNKLTMSRRRTPRGGERIRASDDR